MKKAELVRHLIAVHGVQNLEGREHLTTVASLREDHSIFHERERAASDRFVSRGSELRDLRTRETPPLKDLR
jgi:hypothetical protein